MHEAGKGDSPRPYSVDQKTFESNWDAIFGKKDKDKDDKKEIDNSEGDFPADSDQGG